MRAISLASLGGSVQQRDSLEEETVSAAAFLIIIIFANSTKQTKSPKSFVSSMCGVCWDVRYHIPGYRPVQVLDGGMVSHDNPLCRPYTLLGDGLSHKDSNNFKKLWLK